MKRFNLILASRPGSTAKAGPMAGFEIRGIVPLGTIFGKRYQRIMAAML